MFFNPLFLQITNSGQSVSQLNTQKMNGSSYLFSDIIKVYVENSETTIDSASLHNLTETSASVFSGFVKRLFSDKLNLDELSITSGLNKSENAEELLLKSTLHFNKGDINQLISELINGSSDFNGKISLILDETNFTGSVEKLKESPENLISLLKSGGTLLIEDAELAKDNGLLITIVEPGGEEAKFQEEESDNLTVNTTNDYSEETSDYGIKLSLINLVVDNTFFNTNQEASPNRKLHIILNNPPSEYYSSAKLSSKDISVLAKMSGDTYKQVPFRSTTTITNSNPPSEDISFLSQDNDTSGNVQENKSFREVSANEIIPQKFNPETEQIKVNNGKPTVIADQLKAGDSTKQVIEIKTTSPSVPSQMKDLESKAETISGDVKKEIKIEDNKQPDIHPPQKTNELKSGVEVTKTLSGMESVAKNIEVNTYSEIKVNAIRNAKPANVEPDVNPAANTKIVTEAVMSKDPEAIQTSLKTKEINTEKINDVKNSSGNTKTNGTIPEIIKEIKKYQAKVETAGKPENASVSVKIPPRHTSAPYIKDEAPVNHAESSPESKSQVTSSSNIKLAKENMFPEQNSQKTSAGTVPDNENVDNVMHPVKDVKMNYYHKAIVNEITDDHKSRVVNKNTIIDQIKAEVNKDELPISNDIRTNKEKVKLSNNFVKEAQTPEVVHEDPRILLSKPELLTGSRTMKDVIAKGLKEINTVNTDQLKPGSNKVVDQLKQPELKEFVNEKALSRNEFEQKPDSVKRDEQNTNAALQNQETTFSENSDRSDNNFLNQERNEKSGFAKEVNSINITNSQTQNEEKHIPGLDKQNFELKEKKNVSEQPVKLEQETGSIKKEHSETVLRSETNILTKEKNVTDIPFQQNHSKIIKAAEIVKEMSKFIQDGSKNSIILKLDPENLGSMKIQLDIVNKIVNAQIEVDNEVTQKLVENNLPQLYNTLNQSGIQVNVMNITLNNFDQKNTKNLFTRKKNPGSDTERIVEDKSTVQEKNMGYNTYEYLI